MILRLRIYEKGQRKINMWFPLLLLYLLLMPLFLLFLPFIVLISLVFWIFNSGKQPFQLMFWLYELWCASKGTYIEVNSPKENDKVLVHIF